MLERKSDVIVCSYLNGDGYSTQFQLVYQFLKLKYEESKLRVDIWVVFKKACV